MPRSFLVKKYFTSKKPNYSELESQSGEYLDDKYLHQADVGVFVGAPY